MDPSGASIVKISARTVNPSIPDVEWFNCGYRFTTIHHDGKLAAQQVDGSGAVRGGDIPGDLMIVSYCCHDRD